ncbi:MAG: flavodoxin family protein [Candidatus Latescibacterota bacterium]
MKVIGISGSPRMGGNTETAVQLALEQIEKQGIDTELISLSGKRIAPCSACMGCKTQPQCTIKDDFQPIFEKILDAEGFIVGSPVYFGSATPETMALLDRLGYVARHNGNLLRRKVGGPIAVARRAGQNFTCAQLMFFYTLSEMIVVGSTYWNIAFGGAPGEIAGDLEGVETMRNFGKNVAWVLKKLY